MPLRILLLASMIICLTGGTHTVAGREDVRQYAVEVSAAVRESPPGIAFSWPLDLNAVEYRVFKKLESDTAWAGPIRVLAGTDTTFSDGEVLVGEAYEYSFRKVPATIIDTISVVDGTPVTFTIRDTWSDGICCQHGLGSYRVSGCGTTYASGGEFGGSESSSFTVGGAGEPCSSLVVTIDLDIFGAETTWTLKNASTAATIAQGGPYSSPRFGQIAAGIRRPAIEDLGAVLLLVDEPLGIPLAPELRRLGLDMVRDGYRVRRIDVPHGLPVPDVKEIVLSAHAVDPSIRTLFLFGNISVPYSGDLGGVHEDHQGAWPADLYYGELDGVWTDSVVNDTSASRPENHNVPGDGKFDQTFIPSEVDLEVGRVDLSRLPAFPEDEVTLLRRYLDKDHGFRSGEIRPARRGLIEDNVGEAYGSAYACVGWRNFTAMFGSSNVVAGSWLPNLVTDSYLWAYGCGPSSFTVCGGVASTSDFALRTFYVVFGPLMGSYFGDWDNTDNVLRSPLAAKGYQLACFWSGHPSWHLHHMALGRSIGYSARVTQNNHTLYTVGDGGRKVHIALMGDPTLKLHAVRSPEGLRLSLANPDGILLAWPQSTDQVLGYNVYRADSIWGEFVRLNAELISDTTYVDLAYQMEKSVYMVRAAKLETTASGTYVNLSPGVIDSIRMADVVEPSDHGAVLDTAPNPFRVETMIRFHLDRPEVAALRLYDVEGRLLRTLGGRRFRPGHHVEPWDGRDETGRRVPSGAYFVELVTPGGISTRTAIRVE